MRAPEGGEAAGARVNQRAERAAFALRPVRA